MTFILTPYTLLVTFSVSVITTHLWKSNYSPYQECLFNRISGVKEEDLTPIGYRRISQIFNKEGLFTPRGSIFKNNHVHSIYKKGNIRKLRMERVVKVANYFSSGQLEVKIKEKNTSKKSFNFVKVLSFFLT